MKNKTFAEQQFVLIEQTSKRYKVWMLIGNILGIGSLIAAIIILTTDHPALAVVAIYPFFAGLLIYGAAKFMAWWNHG